MSKIDRSYSTEHKAIEKITATEPQPHRTVSNYIVVFKNVAYSLDPGETPSYSASHRLKTMYNVLKYRKTW